MKVKRLGSIRLVLCHLFKSIWINLFEKFTFLTICINIIKSLIEIAVYTHFCFKFFFFIVINKKKLLNIKCILLKN